MKETEVKISKFSKGRTFKTNEGCDVLVLEYVNCKKVLIEFQDDHKHQVYVSPCKLRSGGVKNPFHPSVVGIAYLGVGVHSTSYDSKHTKAYVTWKHMIRRCYSEKFQDRNPTYRGCTVHPDWLNFQNFAEWYVNHDFYELGYELDKDLKVIGNKVYSEDTCTLVSANINCLILQSDEKTKSNGLPLGSQKTPNSPYYHSVVRIGVSKKTSRTGGFIYPEDAHRYYVETKTAYIKSVLASSNAPIDSMVKKSLIAWCEDKLTEMENYCEQCKSLRTSK